MANILKLSNDVKISEDNIQMLTKVPLSCIYIEKGKDITIPYKRAIIFSSSTLTGGISIIVASLREILYLTKEGDTRAITVSINENNAVEIKNNADWVVHVYYIGF